MDFFSDTHPSYPPLSDADVADMANFTNHSMEIPYRYISPEGLRNVRFSFGIVLILAFALFGSLGNILSLIVLVHHKMRNSTNSCLAALAVSDTLVLLHSLLFASINIIESYDPTRGRNLRAYIFPFFGAYGSIVTARITSWLTTMLSIERFIAVYSPMKAKQLCVKKHGYIGIAFIYTTTVLFFIPLAQKYEVRTQLSSRTNVTMVKMGKTEFGIENENFYKVYGVTVNIFFRVLPLVLIIILNTLIILAIRKTWNIRKLLSEGCPQVGSYEQTRITVMLLAVTCVFVLCILPGAVSSFASKIWKDYSRLGKARDLFQCVSDVAFFLETVNSSINFIIYMALSRKFWRTYKEIFCFQKTKANHKSKTVSGQEHIQLYHRRHRQPSTSSAETRPHTVQSSLRDRCSVCSNGSLAARKFSNGSVGMRKCSNGSMGIRKCSDESVKLRNGHIKSIFPHNSSTGSFELFPRKKFDVLANGHANSRNPAGKMGILRRGQTWTNGRAHVQTVRERQLLFD